MCQVNFSFLNKKLINYIFIFIVYITFFGKAKLDRNTLYYKTIGLPHTCCPFSVKTQSNKELINWQQTDIASNKLPSNSFNNPKENYQERLSSIETQSHLKQSPLSAQNLKGFTERFLAEANLNSSPCWDANTGLQGVVFYEQTNVEDIGGCQQLCVVIERCVYFSYVKKMLKCILYNSVYSIKDSVDVFSGPKICGASLQYTPEKFEEKLKNESNETQQIGRLIEPNELLQILNGRADDNTKQKTDINIQPSQIVDGRMKQHTSDPSNNFQARTNQNYILPDVDTGGLFPNNGNILQNIISGGRSVLENISKLVTNNDNQILTESVDYNIGSTISSAESLLAAGNTALKTFPITDMLQVGTDLIRSTWAAGARSPARGGVPISAKSKADATAPPTGIDLPEVTCLSEGMRCCVPKDAAPRYQSNPPKLNGLNKPRCRATYSSQTNQLCVTTKYSDEECETSVIETADMFVYRNTMELPGKTMNNAICECMISKRTIEPNPTNSQIEVQIPTINGSGKWQYSLVAHQTEDESSAKLLKAAERFEDGTKAASKLASSYMKNLQRQGFNVNERDTQRTSNFFNTIGSIGSEIKHIAETLPKR